MTDTQNSGIDGGQQTGAETDGQQHSAGQQGSAETAWAEVFKDQTPQQVQEALNHARTWESRAKENYEKAKQFDGLADASKTKEQRLNDRIAALESAASTAQVNNLRSSIALKHQVSETDRDLFLTGNDEATLTAQAQRLAQRDADAKKNGNHVAREGTSPSGQSPSDEREFVRDFFGGD